MLASYGKHGARADGLLSWVLGLIKDTPSLTRPAPDPNPPSLVPQSRWEWRRRTRSCLNAENLGRRSSPQILKWTRR